MHKLAIDFETYWDAKCSLKKMSPFEYCRHPDFAVLGAAVFEFGWPEPRWMSEEELHEFVKKVSWETTELIAHNLAFDGYVLRAVFGAPVPKLYSDTKHYARWVWPQQDASLDSTVKRLFPNNPESRKGDFTDTTKGKTLEDLVELGLFDDLKDYAINDLDLCVEVYKALINKIPVIEQQTMHVTLCMALDPTLCLDVPQVIKIRQENRDHTKALIEASGVTRERLSSNHKFADLVEGLGLDLPVKVSPSNPNKTIPALGKLDPGFLDLQKEYPRFKHIWDARLAVKSRILETRASRFLAVADPKTGALPMPIRYGGTHTHRFSGEGNLNPQNLPSSGELRRCILPLKSSDILYVVDWNAIESRVLAWICEEKSLLDAFIKNADVYSLFASSVFGREITTRPEHRQERQVGKIAILAMGFQLGPFGLLNSLKRQGIETVSAEQAQDIVNKFRSMYRRIPAFWEQCSIALDYLYKRSLRPFSFGREGIISVCVPRKGILLPSKALLEYPRLHRDKHTGHLTYTKFIGRNNASGLQKIYGGYLTENIVQAIARHIMVDAMMRALSRGLERSLELVAAFTVHDEIIFTGPRVGAEARMEALVEVLETPPKWAPGLPLQVKHALLERYDK